MDFKKSLTDIIQRVQDIGYYAEDFMRDVWDNLTSNKAKSIGGLVASIILAETVYAATQRPANCGLPANASQEKKELRKKIEEMNLFSYWVGIGRGETINHALEVQGKKIADLYADEAEGLAEKERFISEQKRFLEALGFEFDAVYRNPCSFMACYSKASCNVDEALAKARKALLPAEAAPAQPSEIVTEAAPPATGETAIGTAPPAAPPEAAPRTPETPAQEAAATDYDPLTQGSHPAAPFQTGLGAYLAAKKGELKYHLEAGPIFGVMERTDNDTLEIRDPVTGALISTASLEKLLESDVSGFYANAFASIGDMTLVTLKVRNMKQDGNFKIDGTEASDYERNDISVELGMRRGLYKWTGKGIIAGDLFIRYEGMDDKATDDFGSQESKSELYGGGAGVSAAGKVEIGKMTLMPGLGLSYTYLAGNDDDMRTIFKTEAGFYEIRWNEVLGANIKYTLLSGNSAISDKELEMTEDMHRIALEMILGKKRNFGAGFGWTTGSYEEDVEGSLLDRKGDRRGFDLGLMASYPTNWGRLGIRGSYEQRKTDFENGQGDMEERIGSVGFFVQF